MVLKIFRKGEVQLYVEKIERGGMTHRKVFLGRQIQFLLEERSSYQDPSSKMHSARKTVNVSSATLVISSIMSCFLL